MSSLHSCAFSWFPSIRSEFKKFLHRVKFLSLCHWYSSELAAQLQIIFSSSTEYPDFNAVRMQRASSPLTERAFGFSVNQWFQTSATLGVTYSGLHLFPSGLFAMCSIELPIELLLVLLVIRVLFLVSVWCPFGVRFSTMTRAHGPFACPFGVRLVSDSKPSSFLALSRSFFAVCLVHLHFLTMCLMDM